MEPLLPQQTLSPPEARLWRRAAWALSGLTLALLLPLVLRSLAMVQLDYNEGWNALRQLQAARLQPLYASLPHWDITNYPPLSFHIIGLLSRLGGDVTLIARLVSLVSLLIIGLLTAAITRLYVPARAAGGCAALLFTLWLAIWMPSRIGVNDPQLLGMAFELGGFYLFLRGTPCGLWLSAPLFVLALFTKHNLIALPCGAGLSLLAAAEWSRLIPWAAAGLLTALVLLGAVFLADGPYFLAHLLQPRAYAVADGLRGIATFGAIFLPFILIGGYWSWRARNNPRRRPLAFAWAVALAFGCYCSLGDGVGRNIFFESVLLNSVIAVIACADNGGPSRRLALLVPMLFPLSQFPAGLIAAYTEWHLLPQHAADFAAAETLLRATPGPAVCENLLLCLESGKPSLFDPYHIQDQTRLGVLNQADFTALVLAQRLGAVEIGATDMPNRHHSTRFAKSFLQALPAHYRIALSTPEMTLWLRQP